MKSDLRARCRPGRHSREKPLIQHRPRTRAKFRAAVDAANAIPCLDWSLLNCCDFWLTGAFAPHSRSSFAVRSQSDPRSLSHLHQPKRICLLFSAVGVLCSTKEKKKEKKKNSLSSPSTRKGRPPPSSRLFYPPPSHHLYSIRQPVLLSLLRYPFHFGHSPEERLFQSSSRARAIGFSLSSLGSLPFPFLHTRWGI